MNFSHMIFGKRIACFRSLNTRFCSYSNSQKKKRGLILGVHQTEPNKYCLTEAASNFNEAVSGKLSALLERTALNAKSEKSVVFFDEIHPDYSAVCVVCLQGDDPGSSSLYAKEGGAVKQRSRIATAAGLSALMKARVTDVDVDGLSDAEAVAEAVTLKLWSFDEHNSTKKLFPKANLYTRGSIKEAHLEAWSLGVIKGEAQNLARRLSDAPSNLMTPTIFAENAIKLFEDTPNVKVLVREKNWIESQGMNLFLNVAKGSSEPPIFLEVRYTGGPSDERPVVLVGKGITFDSGGMNIKTAAGMTSMRGDKSGAACVLATVHAAMRLNLPINITVLIPLCENMPNGSAMKVGDIVKGMNGKSVRIDNTDAEGRLILADALFYAGNLKPKFIMDVATLTGAISVALGSEATGVFTDSETLWRKLQTAGTYTGDRMWRLPLWTEYAKNLKTAPSVDLTNIAKSSGGGSCVAAAFLREFVPKDTSWVHLDIAGVMGPESNINFLDEGMSGRPTRTLIQFLMTWQ